MTLITKSCNAFCIHAFVFAAYILNKEGGREKKKKSIQVSGFFSEPDTENDKEDQFLIK